jgi:hypothetical protein
MSSRQLSKIACQPRYACNNRSAAFASMGLFRIFRKLHEQTQPPSSRTARTNSHEVRPRSQKFSGIDRLTAPIQNTRSPNSYPSRRR